MKRLASILLIALTPLTLLPFLIPRVSRQNRWLLIIAQAVLVLTPLVIAVVLAARFEQPAYVEQAE